MSYKIPGYAGAPPMLTGFTLEEVCGLTGPQCLKHLGDGDRDGVYFCDDPADPMLCEGHRWTLAEVRLQLFVESNSRGDLDEYSSPGAAAARIEIGDRTQKND